MKAIAIPRQAGMYVRDARTRQGLSQRELARRAGVSERLVLALELGDAPGIQLNKLMAITRALGIRLFAELPDSPAAAEDAGAVAAAGAGGAKAEAAGAGEQSGRSDSGAEPTRIGRPEDALGRYQRFYDEVVAAAGGRGAL